MKKKLIILTILIVSLAMIMGGCQADKTKATPSPTAVVNPTPAPEPTPEDTSYVVTDSQGTEVAFDETPKTVVSLAPNITEIIFAIECESKLVARTDWCNYPEAVMDYASVGNIDQPDVEKIIELKNC